MRPTEIHENLLREAALVSEPLRAGLASVGPITVESPPHTEVAERLFAEVVNQQLSTRAALAIWTRIETTAAAMHIVSRNLFVL